MLKTLDKTKKRGLRLKNNFRAVTPMSNYPKAVKKTSGYYGAVDKVPPKGLKYRVMRSKRGRGYAVKISHDNDRGSGASGTSSAEIGSGAGLIVCV